MDVEIFRRTVKDRRRGASWELLQHMAEGIRACGDNPIKCIIPKAVEETWLNEQRKKVSIL